jgi:hypothetical protein
MEFRLGSIDFSSPVSGSGPRSGSQAVIFPRPVESAAVGITGYALGFAGDDHHVGRLELRADATTNDNVVIVDATLGVRDWSDDWDDAYQGTVDFVVVADLEPIGEPPPRPDVLITGLELNQAVQFFRAASYLDSAHALPDNAIWLVARKNTGVRVYVDYDASAGLPPISNLTGNLEVRTGATTLELPPINAPITPRPDSTINLGVANDTLNFMIPAAWCQGTLTVKCQVWDQSDPSSKSAAFTRTLLFTNVAPLDIYVVGINYTAGGMNLAAPTQAQFTAQTLPSLVKTYPIGDVAQSGYTSIAFGQTVTGVIGGSCTSGFSALLDTLSDMRGGSSDIYVGVLPAGIVNTPGNQIGGCGRSGLAAVFLDLPGDLPHEVGHAFGRQHAPCTPTGRCNPSPANVDPNYPQYGTFPSDSIGVFGFDATTNTVFNPASTFDFMAYSFPQWVSAYTYSALRGAFPSSPGPSGAGGGAHHLQDRQREYLHLGLDVERDRTVERRPSFHHPGYGLGAAACGEFVLELRDADDDVLLCVALVCGCEETGCDCWPRHVRDTVPWPEDVRTLVVWEGDNKIYEEDVPDPPTVKITKVEEQAAGVVVHWKATPAANGSKDLWYVVHWYDSKEEVWRGVAPRLQTQSLLVPRGLFIRGGLCIRVLATSGIATGYAQRELSLSDYEPQGQVDVILVGAEPGSLRASSVLHAVAIDQSGRELSDATFVWHDRTGAEIGRGNQLDTRTLPPGMQVVRAVVRHSGGLTAKGWYLSHGPEGIDIKHEVLDPDPRAVAERRRQHQHPHPPPPRPKREGPCPPGESGEEPSEHSDHEDR